MSPVALTGERLDPEKALFRVDLARHQAAYRFAGRRAQQARVLDLGCGTGYGAAELGKVAPFVVAIDRITPDPSARKSGVRYLRADLSGLPLARASFDLIVSFQVIEHLPDPSSYLDAIASLLREDATALITTPNRLTSDGVNPYHVHEYSADELTERLRGYFGEVEMLGVGGTGAVAEYHEARLRKIRRITRIDFLKLRERLPRAWIEWLFARLAIVVRRGIQRDDSLPEVTWRDFPIERADDTCFDLLAVCRKPLRG